MNFLRKFLRQKRKKNKVLEDFLTKLYKRGEIEDIEYDLILKILKAGRKPIGDIMIPRVDMVYVKENMILKEAIEIFKKEGFSKMPVIGERKDEIIGILHVKEILKNIDNLNLKVKEIVQDAFYIPEYKKVLDTLSFMQKNRISIAIVVDEFGSVIGLVTMEDILEEIVGEILDELDRPETLYRRYLDGSYVFHSKIELEDVENLLKTELESEEVVSLGGFIVSFLQRVPKRGEKLRFKDLEFEIVDSTPQRIKFVRVKKVKQSEK